MGRNKRVLQEYSNGWEMLRKERGGWYGGVVRNKGVIKTRRDLEQKDGTCL